MDLRQLRYFPSVARHGDFHRAAEELHLSQQALTLINASLSLSGHDSKWRVIVECNNCTDETYTQSAISGYSFLNPPRTYMGRVQVSF